MKARAAAAFVLAAALAVPTQAQLADARKADEVFKDVADTVLRYPQFTIFDDVSAAVSDGVVTLDGRVTMPLVARRSSC